MVLRQTVYDVARVALGSGRREATSSDAVYRFSVAKRVVPSDGDEERAIEFLLRGVASGGGQSQTSRATWNHCIHATTRSPARSCSRSPRTR